MIKLQLKKNGSVYCLTVLSDNTKLDSKEFSVSELITDQLSALKFVEGVVKSHIGEDDVDVIPNISHELPYLVMDTLREYRGGRR